MLLMVAAFPNWSSACPSADMALPLPSVYVPLQVWTYPRRCSWPIPAMPPSRR